MTKAMPALLALFVVVSLPAMTVAAAAPTASQEQVRGSDDPVAVQSVEPVAVLDTPNRLTLTDPARNESIEYGQDLGTILALSDDDMRNEYEWDILFDEEFEDVESDRERDEMINTSLENVRNRTDELEQREEEAVEKHAVEEISTNHLLQILIRNYNDANALEQRIDEIDERADGEVGYTIDVDVREDLQADKERLVAQQGTVRALAASTEQGTGTGTTNGLSIQVETSDAGYRLETMVDDTYVVETTQFDNRDSGSGNRYDDGGQALDRFEELYPWATEDAARTSISTYNENPWNLYQMDAPHSQGILTSFLDSNSGDIFHEVQELDIETLPVSETTTETDNGLEVTHNETPSGGPVEILVHETDTGEPVESATVSIDGTEVGETNRDGSLWHLPSSDEYEVEVESTGETVTLTSS